MQYCNKYLDRRLKRISTYLFLERIVRGTNAITNIDRHTIAQKPELKQFIGEIFYLQQNDISPHKAHVHPHKNPNGVC